MLMYVLGNCGARHHQMEIPPEVLELPNVVVLDLSTCTLGCSKKKLVWLHNTGSMLADFQLAVPPSSSFVINPTHGHVAPGQKAPVMVEFTPTLEGHQWQAIELRMGDSPTRLHILLSATALRGAPVVRCVAATCSEVST